MKRTLLVLAGAFVLAGPVGPTVTGLIAPAPVAVAQDNPFAEWDKRMQKSLDGGAKEYIKLAQKCDKKGLEGTGMLTRLKVFTFRPNHAEMREYFGFEKDPNTGRWVQDEARKFVLQGEKIDEDDPLDAGYEKWLAKSTKTVLKKMRSMALKAQKGAVEDPDNAAAWMERARTAWRWVLKADRDNEQAHEKLDHPTFNGRYCTPYALPFLKAREERKRAAEKLGGKSYKTEPVEAEGMMVDAGLTGGGAQSEHLHVLATKGSEFAAEVIQAGEQGLEDLIETYGFPEIVKKRVRVNRFILCHEKKLTVQLLCKGMRWDVEKAEQWIGKGYSGSGTGNPGERFGTALNIPNGKDSVMNISVGKTAEHVGRELAIADVGQGVAAKAEDWVWTSMSYDATRRILGTASLVWAGDPKYGRKKFADRPGEDTWVLQARYNVEINDDPPLRRLPGLTIKEVDFKPADTVKAYSLLQFLFEWDKAKAQKFVWNALAKGTEEAVKLVYEMSMEDLDLAYHEWILETYAP